MYSYSFLHETRANRFLTFAGIEKLAAPSTQTSPTSIPYASRAEIKTENIKPEPSIGKSYVDLAFLSGFTYIGIAGKYIDNAYFYFTDNSFLR